MSQIRVDPSALRTFARDLKEYCEQLHREEAGLRGDLEQLGKSWKDEKFREYQSKLEAVSAELARFYSDADKYEDFLRRKAAAAERYRG